MPLFDIPTTRKSREVDNKVINSSKPKQQAATKVRGGKGILNRIATISDLVKRKLGHLEKETLLIDTEDELHKYIDKCIEKGICALDTETTGLDPITARIVGWSICTLDSYPAYIPINHESYITNVKCENQLTEEITKKELDRLTENDVKIVMFNADFDIRVFRNQCNCYLNCYWDCYIGARVLNENEPVNKLKPLHAKYVLGGKEDAFTFDDLFKGVTFNLIPINVGYVYAAHDALITLEYQQFQAQYLYYEPDKPFSDRNGMNGVSYAFFNVEMPVQESVCDLEDVGVSLDLEYTAKLSKEYNESLGKAEDAFYEELKNYQCVIDKYLDKHPDAKIDNPINMGSPTQLAILFYDILNMPVVDKQAPRGTGVEILKQMDNPLAKKILDYRGLSKLISTYIDKLPNNLNPKTHRIHCKFNSYGADTGRFSSSDPNLQNIPSKDTKIRKMFRATNDEKIVLINNNITLDNYLEVETQDGWKYADELKIGDVINNQIVDDLNINGTKVNICFKEVM